jgi:hypothetical protein
MAARVHAPPAAASSGTPKSAPRRPDGEGEGRRSSSPLPTPPRPFSFAFPTPATRPEAFVPRGVGGLYPTPPALLPSSPAPQLSADALDLRAVMSRSPVAERADGVLHIEGVMRVETQAVRGHHVHVTYTNDVLAVNAWIRRTILGDPQWRRAAAVVAAAAATAAAAQGPGAAGVGGGGTVFVGLDCEWQANRVAGDDNPVAVIQLATATCILVFHAALAVVPGGGEGLGEAANAALAERHLHELANDVPVRGRGWVGADHHVQATPTAAGAGGGGGGGGAAAAGARLPRQKSQPAQAQAQHTQHTHHAQQHPVPIELARLLADPCVTFVGVGVKNDYTKCVRDLGLGALTAEHLARGTRVNEGSAGGEGDGNHHHRLHHPALPFFPHLSLYRIATLPRDVERRVREMSGKYIADKKMRGLGEDLGPVAEAAESLSPSPSPSPSLPPSLRAGAASASSASASPSSASPAGRRPSRPRSAWPSTAGGTCPSATASSATPPSTRG